MTFTTCRGLGADTRDALGFVQWGAPPLICFWKNSLIVGPCLGAMCVQRFALPVRCDVGRSDDLEPDVVLVAFGFSFFCHLVGCLLLSLISVARGVIWQGVVLGLGAFANNCS